MIYTNEMNLPSPFVSMAKREYTTAANEWRVTSLLKGIRESMLERRHDAEIERDVSDMAWLLFGTAVHRVLESHQEGADEFKEQRIKVNVGDYILSGQFDLYNGTTETVTDYKTCSAWKIIFGDYSDWRRQGLIYCWMLRKLGFGAKRFEVVAFMKDHSKKDAKVKADYPKFPVRVIAFDFTDRDFEEIEEWINDKFAEIEFAEALPDDELPLCTCDERFNSGDKYAVMRNGRKTALRVCGSAVDAEEWMQANGGDYIEVRKGIDKKCADYCAACEFCRHYIENVKEATINE